jgi:hypothetical protein
MECNPIFVAGVERSGTSLMYALLASHPNIAMTRRTNMWTHFYNQYGDLRQRDNFERCFEMMMRYKRLRVLNPDFDRLRDEFLRGERTYGRLFALLEQQQAERTHRPRWGDKSLDTERYADAIFAAYPQAKFLHMIRDPRDRYASAKTRWNARGQVGAGTAQWLASVRLAKRNMRRNPEHYKIVQYEVLVGEPERMAREICKFIGEDYAVEMLSMDGAPRHRHQGNSSYGPRNHGEIFTSSLGRYQKVMSDREIVFMQTFLAREMDRFQYQQVPIRLGLKDYVRYHLSDRPLNLARVIGWTTREALFNRVGRKPSQRRLVDVTEIRNAGPAQRQFQT